MSGKGAQGGPNIQYLIPLKVRTASMMKCQKIFLLACCRVCGSTRRSSLLNRLFGETRSIVSETPGTTRDSIDALFERGGRTYRLVDTAGIRRKGKASRERMKLCG